MRFKLLLVGISIWNLSFAQTQKIAVSGKVYYDFSYVYDTTSGANLFMDEMVLAYGNEGSQYRSFRFMKGIEEFAKTFKEKGVSEKPVALPRGSQDIFFTNKKTKEITRVRSSSIGNVNPSIYFMSEAIIPIKWEISPETKMINIYSCQKAIGICKGRKYTAWFCRDIPWGYGPWKLNGLPGLILEAADTKNEVVFKFNRIDTLFKGKEFIEPIDNYKKITELEFETMRQNKSKTTAMPGMQATSEFSLINQQGKEVRPKKLLINNPIDLESKLPLIF